MKIGTIGSNFIVDRFINATHLVEGVEIVAAYSRSEEKAKAFAEKHNIKKTYTNLQEMMNDAEIDTIYVASPNSLHYEQTLLALNNGKHVINEKPFTSTLEEFDHLASVAKEKKLLLWEAITNIYTPNLNIMKDNLDKVGKVAIVVSNYSQYSSRHQAYLNGEKPNIFMTEFSGGSLMDINLYNVHLVSYLFGKPNDVKYYANKGPNGIDTSGVMIFTYDDFVATLIGAKDSSSRSFASVQGDKGSLLVDNCSIGIIDNVSFLSHKGEKTNIGVVQNEQHMIYEVEAFQKMFEENDLAQCYEKLDYSRGIVEVMEKARKEAGIYFDADKK